MAKPFLNLVLLGINFNFLIIWLLLLLNHFKGLLRFHHLRCNLLRLAFITLKFISDYVCRLVYPLTHYRLVQPETQTRSIFYFTLPLTAVFYVYKFFIVMNFVFTKTAFQRPVYAIVKMGLDTRTFFSTVELVIRYWKDTLFRVWTFDYHVLENNFFFIPHSIYIKKW